MDERRVRDDEALDRIAEMDEFLQCLKGVGPLRRAHGDEELLVYLAERRYFGGTRFRLRNGAERVGINGF